MINQKSENPGTFFIFNHKITNFARYNLLKFYYLHFIIFALTTLFLLPFCDTRAGTENEKNTKNSEDTISFLSDEKKAEVLETAKRLRAEWEPFPELKIFYMDKLGIRRVAGRHVEMFTDLVSTPETDEIVNALDAAVPELCRFFDLDPNNYTDWKVTAFLMSEREPFELFNAFGDAPDFPNGYSLGDRIWIYDKKQPYFNRFLLLHELVHVFMSETFGSLEPRWYSEGIAEFLALHRWESGKITLGIFPDSAQEVPGFGRIDRIQEVVQEGNKKNADEIFAYGFEKYEEIEVYAWCWLMVTFLANNPRYSDAFAALPYLMREPDPTRSFRRLLGKNIETLPLEIDDFASRIDYSYDFSKNQIDFTPGEPISGPEASYTLEAGQGAWQNTHFLLEAGKTYKITAQGRFKVSIKGRFYPCEANGITLRYQNGLPTGRLTAAVISDPPDSALSPVEIGTKGNITPAKTGTLYLKLNLPPGEIDRAEGNCTVRIVEKGNK